MAFIRKRGNKFCVVYKVKDEDGVEHQKSETYASQKEADRRKKEIEYKMSVGKFEAPKCVRLHELIEEYVKICKSPERICRGLSVLWEKPMTGEFEIILIHENLGY